MKFLENAYPKPDPKTEGELAVIANEMMAEIEEHLGNKSGPKFRKSKGFSPSATNLCARLATYLLEGVDIVPDISPQLQRIFDNGNSTHERIAKYFVDVLGHDVEVERRVISPPPPISSFLDLVVTRYKGAEFVIEVKSINERGFEARKNMRMAKDDHYRQIQLYLEITGIKQGIVLYENKNTQEWLPVFVTYNAEYVKPIMERYGKIYSLHLAGGIPKRPHKQTTKVCQGCDVKDRCWSDDREGTEKL